MLLELHLNRVCSKFCAMRFWCDAFLIQNEMLTIVFALYYYITLKIKSDWNLMEHVSC
jgi:hypothetical protein